VAERLQNKIVECYYSMTVEKLALRNWGTSASIGLEKCKTAHFLGNVGQTQNQDEITFY
jgi:hypothetical protein